MTRGSSSARPGRPFPGRGAAAAVVALLSGCASQPERATVAVQPGTAPVRNIGSFDEALRCMDDMFLAAGKRDIFITTAGIPDATGLIAAGTKEMFISAVSKMSTKSGAFRFVDYDPTQTDVQILSEIVGLRQDFVAPSYYVRGAITQLDSSVRTAAQGRPLARGPRPRRLARPGRLGGVDGPQRRPAGHAPVPGRHLGPELDRGRAHRGRGPTSAA